MGLRTVHRHRLIETLTAAMTPEMKPEPLRPRMKRIRVYSSGVSMSVSSRKSVKEGPRSHIGPTASNCSSSDGSDCSRPKADLSYGR